MTQVKALKGIAALAITVLATGYSQAVFTTVGTPVQKHAIATLTAAGTVALNSVVVKSIATNATVTDVTWSNPTLGAWALADDYLQIDAVTTANASGIQIWTDNIHGTAPYKSTLTDAERVTITPAGLVSGNDGKQTIPLAWAIKPILTPTFTAVDPNAGLAFPDSFSWHYTPDKGSLDNPATTGPLKNEAYADAADYQTVQKPAGIHTGQAPTEYFGAANPKIIYLEGDFAAASTPNTYGTTTLTIEAFQQ